MSEGNAAVESVLSEEQSGGIVKEEKVYPFYSTA